MALYWFAYSLCKVKFPNVQTIFTMLHLYIKKTQPFHEKLSHVHYIKMLTAQTLQVFDLQCGREPAIMSYADDLW